MLTQVRRMLTRVPCRWHTTALVVDATLVPTRDHSMAE